jgi:phage terminase Nu1 subunit (DNA packaging protein)
MNLNGTVKNGRYTDLTSVGKKQLCDALGWSRARLDSRISADENFPVLQRGNQGGGWLFDIAAVLRYLATVPGVLSPGRKSGHDRVGAPRNSAQQLRAQLAQIQAVRRTVEALVDELGTALDRFASSLGHGGLKVDGERDEDGPTH